MSIHVEGSGADDTVTPSARSSGLIPPGTSVPGSSVERVKMSNEAPALHSKQPAVAQQAL
jgi:hypothetical protein